MQFPTALLENWMRACDFEGDHDMGSSRAESCTLGELRRLLGSSVTHGATEASSLVIEELPVVGSRARGRGTAPGNPPRILSG